MGQDTTASPEKNISLVSSNQENLKHLGRHAMKKANRVVRGRMNFLLGIMASVVVLVTGASR